MARVLEPSQFGVFSAIFALVAIAFSIGDLGIGPAIINFLPKTKTHKTDLLVTSFWFQYSVGVVFLGLFWLLATRAGILIPGSLAEHFFLIGSLSFNYILIGWAQSVFTAERNFSYITISQSIDAGIKIILVYLLLRSGNLTISTAMVANCTSAALALLITTWRRLLGFNLFFNQSLFKQLFSYSKWIALSRFFTVFTSRIDILLLNFLSGSFQAGIFSAASRVTLFFAIIVSGLGSVVNPRFSRFEKRSQVVAYIKKLAVLISFLSLFVITCSFLAKPIIDLVYGASYSDAIKVFQLLSISTIPFLYSVINTGVILYVYNDSAFYAKTTAIQFAIIIFIDSLFIGRLGSMAPVLATAVSNTVILILSSLRLIKLLGSPNLPKNIVLENTI